MEEHGTGDCVLDVEEEGHRSDGGGSELASSVDTLLDNTYFDDEDLNEELVGTLSEMSDRDQFSLYSEVEPLQQSFQHQDKKYSRMEKQKSEESSDSMQSTIRRVETQWEQYRLRDNLAKNVQVSPPEPGLERQ